MHSSPPFINCTTHYKYILHKQIPKIKMSGGAETITRSGPIASGSTTCARTVNQARAWNLVKQWAVRLAIPLIACLMVLTCIYFPLKTSKGNVELERLKGNVEPAEAAEIGAWWRNWALWCNGMVHWGRKVERNWPKVDNHYNFPPWVGVRDSLYSRIMNLWSLIPEKIWNLPATNVELSKVVPPLLVKTRKPIIFVYLAQP